LKGFEFALGLMTRIRVKPLKKSTSKKLYSNDNQDLLKKEQKTKRVGGRGGND
jgi:hypothetical protein